MNTTLANFIIEGPWHGNTYTLKLVVGGQALRVATVTEAESVEAAALHLAARLGAALSQEGKGKV